MQSIEGTTNKCYVLCHQNEEWWYVCIDIIS